MANRVYWGLLQLGGICAWQGSGRRPGGCLYHLNDACRACRPVILVTTKDQETDKVWGERQGAAGYIVKPAQEPELAAMIKRVLG